MSCSSRVVKSAPPRRFGVVRLKTPAASSRSMFSWGMRRCRSATGCWSRSQGCSSVMRPTISSAGEGCVFELLPMVSVLAIF